MSTRNFICPPHFIKAAPRPENSSPLDSSIIANSKWPVGLSTGIFPPSARISMKKAISKQDMRRRKERRRAGDPLLLNDVRDGRLRHERYGEEHDHENRLR